MTKPKSTNPSKDAAIRWVVRLREESCTAAERQQFAQWLTEQPQHQSLFNLYDQQWQNLDRFKGQDFPVRRAALQYRAPKHYRQQRWLSLATAAVLILAIGLTAFSPEGWLGTNAHYLTAQGGHQTITLADGSQIELNSDTEVNVRLNHWNRSVELVRGEAYFQVVHNAERPFVVTAGTGQITDIGTRFEVYKQTDKVLVAVQEGSVQVNARESRDLTANQLLAYNRSGDFIQASADSVDNLTAWRQGQLVFDNRNLEDVLSELSRYHRTQIRLGNPALAKLKVSGRFSINQFDSALNNIAATLSLTQYRPSADVVVLKRRF